MTLGASDELMKSSGWLFVWIGFTEGCGPQKQRLYALDIIEVISQKDKQFLAIQDGMRESTQNWRELLLNQKARGLNWPELVIEDEAMGLWEALEEITSST